MVSIRSGAVPDAIIGLLRMDWCLEPESNQRDMDFQSIALPAELSRHILVGRVGIEPTVFLVWRIYSPLHSPAMHTCPYNGGGGRTRTCDTRLLNANR